MPYDRAVAQNEQEIAFVKTVLAEAQAKSIKANREYCGYIGLDAQGEYVATPPKRGRKNSCRSGPVPKDFTALASYHTHGSYSDDHDSELPSVADVETDVYEGTDGYISTPAGRVWFIDGFRMTAKVLCSEGCLQPDENYKEDPSLGVGRIYTIDELERLYERENKL